MLNILKWLNNKLSRSNGGNSHVVLSNGAALDLPDNGEFKITVKGCGGGGGTIIKDGVRYSTDGTVRYEFKKPED